MKALFTTLIILVVILSLPFVMISPVFKMRDFYFFVIDKIYIFKIKKNNKFESFDSKKYMKLLRKYRKPNVLIRVMNFISEYDFEQFNIDINKILSSKRYTKLNIPKEDIEYINQEIRKVNTLLSNSIIGKKSFYAVERKVFELEYDLGNGNYFDRYNEKKKVIIESYIKEINEIGKIDEPKYITLYDLLIREEKILKGKENLRIVIIANELIKLIHVPYLDSENHKLLKEASILTSNILNKYIIEWKKERDNNDLDHVFAEMIRKM